MRLEDLLDHGSDQRDHGHEIGSDVDDVVVVDVVVVVLVVVSVQRGVVVFSLILATVLCSHFYCH